MGSELDQRYDRVLAQVTGPGGMLAIGRDELGQAIVTNFPATLPGLIRDFAKINAEHEAVVAGDERLGFLDIDALSERLARAQPQTLAAAGRVAGITPAALATLLVHAKRRAA